MLTVDMIHEITDRLEHQAGIEPQKATSYHEGYVQACEDFVREMRQEILNKQEEDWRTDMQGLEKILEEFGSYICDELCYYRETSVDKQDDEMEEICAGCKVGKYLESIRKHMNDGWIPVEERLPGNNENVLVTTDMGLIASGYIAHGTWITDQEPDCPIAWRPLPEPYRPERSRE